jgi:hypothetical protein
MPCWAAIAASAYERIAATLTHARNPPLHRHSAKATVPRLATGDAAGQVAPDAFEVCHKPRFLGEDACDDPATAHVMAREFRKRGERMRVNTQLPSPSRDAVATIGF